MERLKRILHRIDGRKFQEYKHLEGQYDLRNMTLFLDRVQRTPLGPPSLIRVEVPFRWTRLPGWSLLNEARRIGVADFVLRLMHEASQGMERKGEKRELPLRVDMPQQEILERSACHVSKDGVVTLRFYARLPADHRGVIGPHAWKLLAEELAKVVEESTRYDLFDADALRAHVYALEDQRALRDQLAEKGLVAFIADGASLPRRKDKRGYPLHTSQVKPWSGPRCLTATLETPNRGMVTGTGIPHGLTLITGANGEGKTTLLNAIAQGVNDHVPGDGRELVVADSRSLLICAERGRKVSGVDLSILLPKETAEAGAVEIGKASPSMSQAVALVESLELGVETFIFDEDTSSPDFFSLGSGYGGEENRDPQVNPLSESLALLRASNPKMSVLIALEDTSAFKTQFDALITLDAYLPDAISCSVPQKGSRALKKLLLKGDFKPSMPIGRVPIPKSFNPLRSRTLTFRGRDRREIEIGKQVVMLRAFEQLADSSQVRMICDVIEWALNERVINGHQNMRHIFELMERRLRDLGPTWGYNFSEGDRALVRGVEVIAVINRLRELRVRHLRSTQEVSGARVRRRRS